MNEYTLPIVLGVIIGTIGRILMLRTDYRQYPTYLHGKIIHVALGFIAASLGAVAVPALMEMNFTAVTFLTVAATQFREVRNMERNTLSEIDDFELVSRGKAYIEGIAISFESRNYLVIMTAFITTLFYLLWNVYMGFVGAILCLIISKILQSGSTINDLVDIEYVEPHFDGAGLYVDNIYIMNIGLPERQEEILRYGMGFVLKPKNINVVNTIAHLGQRQAILHDVSVSLGVFRDSGTPALVPLIKRDLDDGRLGVFILPQIRDKEKAMKIIGAVPVLETAIRMPSKSDIRQEVN
ncbi:YIEGIA family protein [Ornithinibacillus sp. 179-J 7C1 HS]|uniref:YIEGIA family protein n=1 Tax=Ornithinibacillus sp. 179-J 7C1 HS TaxID=3142384 RepID=UPI0039A28CFF